MHLDSPLVLRGYGTEPGDFRARQLTDAHAAEADLILTMTSDHRRKVLARAPRALARTFTLREAAALLEILGEEFDPAGQDLGERARSLVKSLAEARARRSASDTDDVPDPIGRPLDAHGAAGEFIVEAFLPLLARLTSLRAGAAEPA